MRALRISLVKIIPLLGATHPIHDSKEMKDIVVGGKRNCFTQTVSNPYSIEHNLHFLPFYTLQQCQLVTVDYSQTHWNLR